MRKDGDERTDLALSLFPFTLSTQKQHVRLY